MTNTTTAVAGGGPAGLAAARELALGGAGVTVLEKDNIVGGISRTEERRGFRFDVGGHRFFTKIPEVNCIWEEMCGDDFLTRTRLSRIFYRGRLMDYPLSIGSTLRTLGLTDSIMALCSYGAAQLRSVSEESFEGWVTSRFGRRLYEHFFSSMPPGELVLMMDPAPPADVLEAARALRQRSFLTAGLIVRQADPFPDQWIYVHEPDVMVGRVQNYRNWSPYMVPDEDACAIGAEYFAWTDDPLWSEPDEAVIDLARRELAQLGLVDPESVEDGIVMRVENAYPVYDPGYRERVGIVREWLSGIPNLQTIGRGGQHRYNNMDHSCMTGMRAASNILGEEHDVWSVNVEEEYLERRESREADRAGTDDR